MVKNPASYFWNWRAANTFFWTETYFLLVLHKMDFSHSLNPNKQHYQWRPTCHVKNVMRRWHNFSACSNYSGGTTEEPINNRHLAFTSRTIGYQYFLANWLAASTTFHYTSFQYMFWHSALLHSGHVTRTQYIVDWFSCTHQCLAVMVKVFPRTLYKVWILTISIIQTCSLGTAHIVLLFTPNSVSKHNIVPSTHQERNIPVACTPLLHLCCPSCGYRYLPTCLQYRSPPYLLWYPPSDEQHHLHIHFLLLEIGYRLMVHVCMTSREVYSHSTWYRCKYNTWVPLHLTPASSQWPQFEL